MKQIFVSALSKYQELRIANLSHHYSEYIEIQRRAQKQMKNCPAILTVSVEKLGIKLDALVLFVIAPSAPTKDKKPLSRETAAMLATRLDHTLAR